MQYNDPAGWHNGNEESVPTIGSACVTEVAGVTGSLIRLETMVNENDTARAFFTNGDPMSGGRLPCASQPLMANVRYNIPGNDTALILIMFKRMVPSSDECYTDKRNHSEFIRTIFLSCFGCS